MADIVLSTLNAKYIHSAFGLRYIYAQMGDLQARSEILEFTITERAHEIVERLLTRNPEIIGFGVYIWNVRQTQSVIGLLKRVAPDIRIVIGGPEVSYETIGQPIVEAADFTITGEADFAFRDLCRQILAGTPPAEKIHHAVLPRVTDLASPYPFYTEDDIANRVMYVEASRGCPFTCEFCLSSLDLPVRQFDVEPFLVQMDDLLKRGVRQFKFVDRTFNLNLRIGRKILQFFLDRYTPGLFIHFEMVPDRLPEALRELIVQFPAGALQFEVGIQSFSIEVGALISRRQDFEKLADNIRFLRESSGVHIHADLIVGLPGEDMQSFAAGFNRLVELDPQEIQVGILKRLRGTPIIRHDAEWGMVYSPEPPYELLCNRLLDFSAMQRLGRFSRYWDLISNSGNFPTARDLLWQNARSPFDGFMAWSDWLYQKTGARHAFSVKNLAELLYEFLTTAGGVLPEEAGAALSSDYLRAKRSDLPHVLRPFVKDENRNTQSRLQVTPDRQARHLMGDGVIQRVHPGRGSLGDPEIQHDE